MVGRSEDPGQELARRELGDLRVEGPGAERERRQDGGRRPGAALDGDVPHPLEEVGEIEIPRASSSPPGGMALGNLGEDQILLRASSSPLGGMALAIAGETQIPRAPSFPPGI